MAKDSKTVKKTVTKTVKTAPKKSSTTSGKAVEKILKDGLNKKVEYTREDDTFKSKDVKGSKSKKIAIDKPKPTKVEHGHLVSVEYVGTLKSGEEFDNSKTNGPIQFVVGNGQVIPGFDKAVIGMKINEKKKFNIPKNEAYGDTNPTLIQIVPLSKIPDHIKTQLKVGGFLVMQAPTGQQVPVKIIKLDKDNVHLDMNHPLAGQDLTFDIKLVDINHAPEHGECGCGDGDCGDDCSCDDKDDDSCNSCGCGHDHK